MSQQKTQQQQQQQQHQLQHHYTSYPLPFVQNQRCTTTNTPNQQFTLREQPFRTPRHRKHSAASKHHLQNPGNSESYIPVNENCKRIDQMIIYVQNLLVVQQMNINPSSCDILKTLIQLRYIWKMNHSSTITNRSRFLE
jgi:hypothetical protein